MPKRTINTLPAEIPAEIPAKYWDKMKALADKLGGVGGYSMFDKRYERKPYKLINYPVCIIGFAKAVGLTDRYYASTDGDIHNEGWDGTPDLFWTSIGDQRYHDLDLAFRKLAFDHGLISDYNGGNITEDMRLPFELVMSNAGLTRAED